jgi:hypothetical protein
VRPTQAQGGACFEGGVGRMREAHALQAESSIPSRAMMELTHLHSLSLSLSLSLSAVCLCWQHCFLVCAGNAEELDEWGKLVLQGPPRPVPLVHQLPA